MCALSCVQFFAAPRSVARQAPLSMRVSSAMSFPGGDNGLKKKKIRLPMQEAEDVWGPKSANLMAYFLFFLKCVCVLVT